MGQGSQGISNRFKFQRQHSLDMSPWARSNHGGQKERNYQLGILYNMKISLRDEGEITTLSDEEIPRDFIANRPVLK